MEYKSQDDTSYKVEDLDEKDDHATVDGHDEDMDIAHMMVDPLWFISIEFGIGTAHCFHRFRSHFIWTHGSVKLLCMSCKLKRLNYVR